MTKYCKNCGAELKNGVKFCEECGAKVPEEKPARRFCSSCGRELVPDASFCRFCGARVEAGSHPAVTPVQPVTIDPPNRGLPNPPPARQTPAAQNKPDYMQPGYQQRVRAERQSAQEAAKPKKSYRGLSLFLAFTLAVEFCIAGFKYPGFLKKGGLDQPGIVTGKTDGKGDSGKYDAQTREFLDSLGITEEQLEAFRGLEIEATPENSPGNPRFIEARYTKEDYAFAQSLDAKVTRDNPEADFPQFGIHIDLKSWNLDSEEDTLTVKKLPMKTDAATDCELYAYDYSLASGQHEFYTDVEITVPLQGDPAVFDGVLYYNESADVWEDAYCELSEDGKTYTLYTSHFSTDAERTDQKLKKLMKEVQAGLDRFTDQNGTIFRILPEEYPSKYPGSKTFLYKVGIRSDWKIETFFSQQTKESLALYESLMKKGGGVPTEAGTAEGWGVLGERTDFGSSAQTGTSILFGNTELGKIVTNSSGWNVINVGISIIGLYTLMMRCLDQWQRGVSFTDIAGSNKWNFVSAALSSAGLFMTACKYLGIATVAGVSTTFGATALAVVGAALYAYTKIDAEVTKAYNFNYPLGQPKTLEDAAYYYYLSDYGWNSSERPEETEKGDAAAYAFIRLIESDPTDFDDSRAPVYHTLDIRGNGWALALNYLFEKYRDDPVKLGEMVKKLCDDFIERFWSDEIRPSVRYDCWKKALNKLLADGRLPNYYRKHQDAGENVMTDSRAMEQLGIDKNELQRRKELQAFIDDGRSIDGLFDNAAERDKYIRFDDMDKEALKEKARAVLNKNLNPICYAIYQKYYKEAFQQVLREYREELLPLLNTRITFYMKDTSVKEGATSAVSKYDHFGFVGYNAQFDPSNKEVGPHTIFTNMALEYRANTPVLLETLVYHYVRAGCPTRVNVKCTADGMAVDGYANWADVNISVDENSLWSGTEPKYWENWQFWEVWKLYVPGGVKENEIIYKRLQTVKDMKVPVEYEGDPPKGTPYLMVLQSNSPIEYTEPPEKDKNGDWFKYTPYGADNLVTVTGNEVTVSLNAINYVWRNSSFGELGESRVFTFKRDALTVSGTFTEEWENSDGYICKKYTLNNPPAISGSYREEEDWDEGRKYYDNKYTASEWKAINSYSLTKEYKITGTPSGTVLLYFDSAGTKLIKAVVSIGGSGTYSWKYDEGYLKRMQGMMENGTENKGVYFDMTLRSTD
ncbi:MAG: zinc ribbon domain-containing protein [Clostridia bacterium]|nr:zinc ribbon domain-containing protein [Clostridia bacterium]